MTKRNLLLSLLALLVVTPALAQMRLPNLRQLMVPPTATRPTSVVVAPPGPLTFDPANDPDRARALIQKLRTDNRQLKGQMKLTLGDLQDARHRLDEMTSAGGSLVTAQCVSPVLSRNTAGAAEDCSASGYTCAAVSGLCHRSCTTSDMCSGGFVCDIPAGRCVVPSSGDDG